jgi:hypothetical protein
MVKTLLLALAGLSTATLHAKPVVILGLRSRPGGGKRRRARRWIRQKGDPDQTMRDAVIKAVEGRMTHGGAGTGGSRS